MEQRINILVRGTTFTKNFFLVISLIILSSNTKLYAVDFDEPEICFLDTVNSSGYTMYYDVTDYTYHVIDKITKKRHLASIELIYEFYSFNFMLFIKTFGWDYTIYYEYPKSIRSMAIHKPVYFKNNPDYFVRVLIRGRYYNLLLSPGLDDPSPFHEIKKKPYYLVYVPIWTYIIDR